MKIVLPGGTGQVGTVLARAFSANGHEVVLLSRRAGSGSFRTVEWDAKSPGDWTREIDGADVVVNLAGRSVDCRYTPANRRLITDSRVDSTNAIGRAIAEAAAPPAVWLQMSTATIYDHRYEAANDEATGVISEAVDDSPDTWNFSLGVARAWEAAAESFDLPHTRQVLLRSAMVMSPDTGGVFSVLLGLVRRGLGGRQGDGRQFVSWIHDRDFVRSLEWIIERDDLAGPVNIAAPKPLPNADFMAALREAWGRRFGLPATEWMIELGAVLLRTESELVLKSRRVVPGKLLESGFAFDFPDWPTAAKDLCRRWRADGERSRRATP